MAGLHFPGEQLVLDARVRQQLPGQTAWLSDGVTYYEEGGPAGKHAVILVHGFSVPNFIWDRSFPALVKAGLRTIRYDLYGRGYSDRPPARYDLALYVRQLAELMDALKVETADLVALSMGGSIAAEFAFRFPKRVGKLAFLDPAGFALDLPRLVKLLNVRGLGEFLLGTVGRYGAGTLVDSMLNDFYSPTEEAIDYFVPRYMEQMKYHGFIGAILSTLRSGMLDENLELYRRIGASDKPVLLVWGEEDETVPFRHHDTFLKLVPQTQFHPIAKARHIPHFEQPELVNPMLLDFLRS